MENKAKIRINLNLREFEIEGSEEFVNSHSSKIESIFELLKKAPPIEPIKTPAKQSGSDPIISNKGKIGTIPDTFGEYYQMLPNKAKDLDKILIAGHFAQIANPDSNFTTNDASKLLLDQGVKLSNPAMSISANHKAKRLIKLGKGKFKVSKDGEDYIKQLISGAE